MTKVNQPPAQHAVLLARIALVRMFAVMLIWFGILYLAGHATPFSKHQVLLAALGVFALAGAVVFSHARSSRYKALIGAKSERRVAAALKALGPVGLLNSTLIGAGGDADHIVVGPWLAVIETKTGHGAVSYDGHQMRAGTRTIPGDPVSQVQRQAAVLHRMVGDFVDAIVCVVDMTNSPYRVGSTTVCSLTDLPGILRDLPSRLDPVRAERLYNNISSLRLTAAPTAVAHPQ